MSQPKTHPRTIALAPGLSLPSVDFKLWGIRIGLTLFCLVSALALTASRIETTKLRYQLNSLHQKRQSAQAEVSRLEMELANLARPQRIESVARAMGMVEPRGDKVIVMNE